MARAANIRSLVSRAGVPALSIIFMLFFGYYAVLGPNGVLRYGDYVRQRDVKAAQFAELQQARAELRNRVRLLDQKRADPDMVDELVRTKLNVVHPNEVIIPLD